MKKMKLEGKEVKRIRKEQRIMEKKKEIKRENVRKI